jgi:hypothetical protein
LTIFRGVRYHKASYRILNRLFIPQLRMKRRKCISRRYSKLVLSRPLVDEMNGIEETSNGVKPLG